MQILKEDIKNSIIIAAKEEFIKKGFKQASMRIIAKEAGISVSNLYNYFKGKKTLFESIVCSTFNELNKLKKKMTNHSEKHSATECTVKKNIFLFSTRLSKLINNYHSEIVLLFDKSKGTKFETTKDSLFDSITNHFINHVAPKHNLKILKDQNTYFVVHIIVNNLVETLAEICRHYKNPNWAKKNIEMYFNYHIAGMIHLMDNHLKDCKK